MRIGTKSNKIMQQKFFISEIYILRIKFVSNQNFNVHFLDEYPNA
jgi:hypothetical protein